LCGQHAVKGIAMRVRPRASQLSVLRADRQRCEAGAGDPGRHIGSHLMRLRQLAEPVLGGDFPDRRAAHENRLRGVRQPVAQAH
jgi:hypothetical protein